MMEPGQMLTADSQNVVDAVGQLGVVVRREPWYLVGQVGPWVCDVGCGGLAGQVPR